MEKEPVASPDHKPKYGQAYEHDAKEAKRPKKESAGLTPKHPIDERKSFDYKSPRPPLVAY